MLACTASSLASLGKPEVTAPSKNSPCPLWLLSPPVPNNSELSTRIGEYPFGSGPEYGLVSPPLAALPYLSVKLLVPLFFSHADTNGKCTPELFGSLLEPVLVWYMPFSRSASTHGPLPTQLLNQQAVPHSIAFIVALPVSVCEFSPLP